MFRVLVWGLLGPFRVFRVLSFRALGFRVQGFKFWGFRGRDAQGRIGSSSSLQQHLQTHRLRLVSGRLRSNRRSCS